jgi:hypothetical protein
MKITDAVFFTDNKVVRLEAGEKKYYLTDNGKIYDMHPVNVMAEEIKGDELKKVKELAKRGGYNNDTEVKKWL